MPSFDIVSEIDKQEIDNALNQARKELATRFDFKGAVAEIEQEKDKIILTAEDASRLRGLREIVIGKLSKRGVDLRNVDQQEPAISSIGHARQESRYVRRPGGSSADVWRMEPGEYRVGGIRPAPVSCRRRRCRPG